ncbi:Glutamyl-tRNA(Gln) amidotransferase subunit A [Pigmentiphaga humi]|uniref:Glutamyl-tRNA(Gln) amidotransferase subunit A n=1 Tax=Pigmentiphaga humi TaxID=2478468 RepID=A0A3P4AYG8_9BURK|nr:amidase [Pigmentiphaga humi]VCU68468.1 Glutamyl-tRNA(Gln) amidotransferase subunit A [Pigmentiphaga humi]
MNIQAPNFLSALSALQAIEDGSLSSEALVRACLERIAERDAAVQAFAHLDPDRAIRLAQEIDKGRGGGALRGLPFAAKDILDSADLPTAYGSSIYAGHRPGADAACIAMAREAGAVLLGKTATCEFATLTPCATRHPLDPSRTPGGSSSGSAAAVADGMVPVAFGSQTGASIIRPAAYCGVVGYKPSYGLINSSGLKHVSPSLDTIGVFTRTVADARYVVFGAAPEPALHAPRIAVCESGQWDSARPETVEALRAFTRGLERGGARVSTRRLPANLEAAAAMQIRLSAFEARHSLAHERMRYPDRLSPRLRERVDLEAGMSMAEYADLRRSMQAAQRDAENLFDDADVLLYPAADGEAEVGMETGSPRFGALWTFLHLPALSIPIGRGPAGLPLGAQLIGAPGRDLELLAAARFAEGLAIRD